MAHGDTLLSHQVCSAGGGAASVWYLWIQTLLAATKKEMVVEKGPFDQKTKAPSDNRTKRQRGPSACAYCGSSPLSEFPFHFTANRWGETFEVFGIIVSLGEQGGVK